MHRVELLSAAWFGDRPVEIAFPSAWDVSVVGRKAVPALSADEMRDRLRRPIGTPPLSELARGRRRAAIVIDDMSRPTPTGEILPLLLEELAAAGIGRDAVTVVVACGAHHVATPEEIALKAGAAAAAVAVVPHDSDRDAVRIGTTDAGTPVLVNKTVMECDLKIGVGGIYPHRCAGYSGGSKIVAPGVAGTETVRHLHDYFRGGHDTGDNLDNEMRREIDAIAGRVGLDFIVNVILSQERRIAGLFAGDRKEAFRAGTRAADAAYGVAPARDADVIVANTYPFDTSLQYMPRGFWPLANAKRGATKIVVGAAPMGRGYHRLGPFDRPLHERVMRRLRDFRPTDARHWRAGVKIVRHIASRWRHDFLVWSPGLTREAVLAAYPGAAFFGTWDELLGLLERRHPAPPVRVAVYPCAPLQAPAGGGPLPG